MSDTPAYNFTIVNPYDERETRVVAYDQQKDETIALLINGRMIDMSKQQASEFGMLLLTLAGEKHIDFDSHTELLDGYGIYNRGKSVANVLYQNMNSE